MHSNLDCVFVYFYVIIYPLQFFFLHISFIHAIRSIYKLINPFISSKDYSYSYLGFSQKIDFLLQAKYIQFSTMRIILLKKQMPSNAKHFVSHSSKSGWSNFILQKFSLFNIQTFGNVKGLRTLSSFLSVFFFCTKLCNVLKDLQKGSLTLYAVKTMQTLTWL